MGYDMMCNARKGPLCNLWTTYRSVCAFVRSDLSILCSLTYTTVSADAFAQADQGLVVHKLHKDPFCALLIIREMPYHNLFIIYFPTFSF